MLPVGTKRSGERGGLVGLNPEALCGEAPKGQPMIRSESLEVVCVEAPQGQPMNHRPRPRQPRNNPTVEEEKRRSLGEAKDQLSSRLMNKE